MMNMMNMMTSKLLNIPAYCADEVDFGSCGKYVDDFSDNPDLYIDLINLGINDFVEKYLSIMTREAAEITYVGFLQDKVTALAYIQRAAENRNLEDRDSEGCYYTKYISADGCEETKYVQYTAGELKEITQESATRWLNKDQYEEYIDCCNSMAC